MNVLQDYLNQNYGAESSRQKTPKEQISEMLATDSIQHLASKIIATKPRHDIKLLASRLGELSDSDADFVVLSHRLSQTQELSSEDKQRLAELAATLS